MFKYIINNAKNNFLIIERVIKDVKTKDELINKIRQLDVVVDEEQGFVNILKDELKIVVNIKDVVEIKEILVYDETYEQYVNLFEGE